MIRSSVLESRHSLCCGVELSKGNGPRDIAALNREVRDIWNMNAAFWDEYMKEGNDFHKLLIAPAQERLLGLREGELVLEIACGNGNFARRMAELGARVVASDFSEVFIERAKARTSENADRIEYRVIDATDGDQLMALGQCRFDAAVCTMGIMDMSSIEPMITSLSRLLRVGGRFVFSLTHPCFNSPTATHLAETEDRHGELVTTYSVKVTDYIRPFSRKGLGVKGQPTAHWYFHRPISMLFGACFDAGFVLDGIEEPVFEEREPGKWPGSWSNYTEIPPALIARMRLLQPR